MLWCCMLTLNSKLQALCQGPFRRRWLTFYLRLIQMSFNMNVFAWCRQVIDIPIPLFFDFCCLHFLT